MPFGLSTIIRYQDFKENSRTKKLKKRSVLKNKLSVSINAFKIFDNRFFGKKVKICPPFFVKNIMLISNHKAKSRLLLKNIFERLRC